MLSWGRVRRALQPLVVRYWLNQRSQALVKTRVEGFEIEVFPTVFHPRYFGSSSIFARFISSLPLAGKSFLDVGCGSGIIGLCAARAGARVTAVDINPDAVRCTLANAERNRLRIEGRVSDLFSALDGEQFDVVACNPPFLLGTARSPAAAAFYGGPDFRVISMLTAGVRTHLGSGGSVYVILSADVDLTRIEQMFRNHHFAVSRVLSTRWLLREAMVILCAQ